MFNCISKFFATLISVFNSVHIISTVGEDYAALFKEESDHKLKLKRLELAKQIALEPVK
jgi:hypothetical protein